MMELNTELMKKVFDYLWIHHSDIVEHAIKNVKPIPYTATQVLMDREVPRKIDNIEEGINNINAKVHDLLIRFNKITSADYAREQEVTMGVGDGDGNLFIHGSHESITRVRDAFDILEKQRKTIEVQKNYTSVLERKVSAFSTEDNATINSLKNQIKSYESVISDQAKAIIELHNEKSKLHSRIERATSQLNPLA